MDACRRAHRHKREHLARLSPHPPSYSQEVLTGVDAELGSEAATFAMAERNGEGVGEERGQEREEEEEEIEVDMTTPLPSLPDGGVSSVYPPAAKEGKGKSKRGWRGASHHFTAKERLALFVSLWPYTVPLITVYFSEYAMQSGAWASIGIPDVADAKARKHFYSYA